METSLPHEIVYDTPALVPVADIIESLRGTLQITREIGPILEALIPGLEIGGISVTVREISQASPLREAFAISVVAIYQKSLGVDVPQIIHDLFGGSIPQEYNNIVSLIFIVVVFFAGQFIFDAAGKLIERAKYGRQYGALVKEIASMLNKSEDEVRRLMKDQFGGARIHSLLGSASRVLQPSKNQGNAPLTINGRAISSDLLAEFPSKAQALEEEPGPVSDPLENVEIRLHAQDMDHNKQGWAAVVPALSPKRIRMHLYPPIKPADIYTKTSIRGDVLVESRRNESGETEPVRVHLIRLRDTT